MTMSQSKELVQALKRALKVQGKTYADVATVLNLSQASVKRLFATADFSLVRIEAILTFLDLEFGELVTQMQKARQQVERLTAEQEAQIAADTDLLIVAVSVINGFTFQDLKQHYRLQDHQLVQKLAQLDRLKMLDLLPGNRIKLRLAQNFRWRKNGPIQTFFLQRIAQEFFDTQFDRQNEKLLVVNTVVSAATNAEVQAKMEVFVNEVSALMQKDRHLPIDQRHGNTLVLALRQWQASVFQQQLKGSVEG